MAHSAIGEVDAGTTIDVGLEPTDAIRENGGKTKTTRRGS